MVSVLRDKDLFMKAWYFNSHLLHVLVLFKKLLLTCLSKSVIYSFLSRFIVDRVQRNPVVDSAEVPELRAVEPINPSMKNLSECLRKIGDELDGNMELQRYVCSFIPKKQTVFMIFCNK